MSKEIIFWDYINWPDSLHNKYTGLIDDSILETFEVKTKKYGLQQLSFISQHDHTVFNYKQAYALRNEIERAKKKKVLPESICSAIEQAIFLVLENNELYIKIKID